MGQETPGSLEAYEESTDAYQQQLLKILHSASVALPRRTIDEKMAYTPDELGLDDDRYTGPGTPARDLQYYQAAKRFTQEILRDLYSNDILEQTFEDGEDRYRIVDDAHKPSDVQSVLEQSV